MKSEEGRRRVVVSGVAPEIDGGLVPIKRTEGGTVEVRADLFADGHDVVRGALLHRRRPERRWTRVPMKALGNDRYAGSFRVGAPGEHEYTVEGRVDRFATWTRDLVKRLDAGQDVSADLLIGADLVAGAAKRARGAARRDLLAFEARLRDASAAPPARAETALFGALADLVDAHPDLSGAVRHAPALRVTIDRERAGFSSWYEIFPRSTSPDPGRAGTFRDLLARLPSIAALGFDVVYLPPIHPIGRTHRKGRNNDPVCRPGDPGSPWAIGAAEGGHEAIHPGLGDREDFRRVVARARELGMEIALDLAFQCSPDHPWAREHPEWFRHRPDGTIQYAENPPKKYQDIYPLDFECEDWRALWEELAGVVDLWIGEGVRIFRVDNPHTKPFRFWEWLIARVRREHPDVIFLAEAFTRPKVMAHLAKVGFSQSYTYFTWREHRQEFVEYLTELTRTPVGEFFRPNFWTNTPDILAGHLQEGGRPMFVARLVLAATLTACYGMYGPAFELLEAEPVREGSEEYLDSEKYEVRHWDLDREGNLRPEIAALNRVRRENPALRQNGTLRFHPSSNDKLLVYSKTAGENRVLVVVTLETAYPHSGWIDLDHEALGLGARDAFTAHDLLTGERFAWNGTRNFVELDPKVRSAHVFRIEDVVPAPEPEPGPQEAPGPAVG